MKTMKETAPTEAVGGTIDGARKPKRKFRFNDRSLHGSKVGSSDASFDKEIGMRFLSALLLFYALGYAEVVYPGFGLIAHIADGGGIQMEFTLTNLDDTASTYWLRFYDDNGNPLSLETNAGIRSDFYDTLAPHASRSIRTAGTAIPQAQGWASITAQCYPPQCHVGASAIFRVSAAPWTGSEVIIPADPARNNRFSLAFDHTDSAVIGLAMVNPLGSLIAVTVTFRGEDGGVIVTDTFNMGGRNHRAIVTTNSYPATVGKRGTIEISTTGSHLSVLALRFGPSAISSVVRLVSSKWSDLDNGCPGCWDY